MATATGRNARLQDEIVGGESISALIFLQSKLVDRLEEKLGKGAVLGDRTGDLTSREFLLIVLGAMGELNEVVEKTVDEGKPWKKKMGREELEAYVFEELVDTLFYLLEAFLFMDKSGIDVIGQYVHKWTTIMSDRLNAQTSPGPHGDLPIDEEYKL